ncbi:hypothetical protein HanRHA438_Chr01g0010341 [Helianthus annuus]|nr:hypothetical protein HanRHA438_Chr01g0010341 [Helianthus annuus]
MRIDTARQAPVHIQTNKITRTEALARGLAQVKILSRRKDNTKDKPDHQHGVVLRQHGSWSTLRFAESEIVQQVQ